MTNFKPWTALFITAFFLFASSSQADVSQTDSSSMTRSESLHTLYLTGELSGGVSSLGAANVNQGSGSGSEFSGALLASWNFSSNWIVDGGFGLFENTVSGSSSTFTEFQMSTTSLLAKISPQYRVTDHFQIGPVAELLFGSDVGFEAGIADSGQTESWLMGAQALYGFQLGANPIKVGLRYLTSVNLPENSLRSFEATVQFGLPVL